LFVDKTEEKLLLLLSLLCACQLFQQQLQTDTKPHKSRERTQKLQTFKQGEKNRNEQYRRRPPIMPDEEDRRNEQLAFVA
jgi:hypothetical protein